MTERKISGRDALRAYFAALPPVGPEEARRRLEAGTQAAAPLLDRIRPLMEAQTRMNRAFDRAADYRRRMFLMGRDC